MLRFLGFFFFVVTSVIQLHSPYAQEKALLKSQRLKPEHYLLQKDPIVIQVIELDYADAEHLASILAPLLSTEGRLVPYRPTNSLIIKDRASVVKRLVEIIKGKSENHNKNTTDIAQKGEKTMALQIQSTAFKQGGDIPKKYTCDGTDVSPPLNWTLPPEGTKSLALICDDPDAPVGTWVHWVLFGLPPDTRELPEGVPTDKVLPEGGKQGINDFGNIGYGGPCPPPGPAHRYFFKLYALDAEPDLKPGATKKELLKAIDKHTLVQAELMGRYGR